MYKRKDFFGLTPFAARPAIHTILFSFREAWIQKNEELHATTFSPKAPDYNELPLDVRGNTFPNPKGYVVMPKVEAKNLAPGKVDAGCPPAWFGGVSRDLRSTSARDYVNPLDKVTDRPAL